MPKVKAIQIGIVHYQASCLNCNWLENDHIDRAALRRKVRNHVKQTGHSVSVEKVVVTRYKLAA